MPPSTPERFHLDKRAGEIAERGRGDLDDLLDTRAVAAWIGNSEEWVEVGRHRGYGPRFVRLGPRRIRYRRGAVLEWLREREYQSTAEYPERPRSGRGRRKEAAATDGGVTATS